MSLYVHTSAHADKRRQLYDVGEGEYGVNDGGAGGAWGTEIGESLIDSCDIGGAEGVAGVNCAC